MKLSQKELMDLLSAFNPSLYAGKDLKINCPECSQREAYISLVKENHVGACFRKAKCGYSFNIFKLHKDGHIQLQTAPQTYNPLLPGLMTLQEEKVAQKPLECLRLGKEFIRIPSHPYLTGRGIPQWQTSEYPFYLNRLNKNYLYMGVEMGGQLTGYLGRLLGNSDVLPKYNNAKVDFGRMLYGYDELTENTTDVLLVEGVFDKLATDRNLGLHEQQEFKCMATFGAKVSEDQIQLLLAKNIQNIHLLFEQDVIEKIKPIAAKVSHYFPHARVYALGEKDPGEMNSDELLAVLDNPRSFLEVNLSFLKPMI